MAASPKPREHSPRPRDEIADALRNAAAALGTACYVIVKALYRLSRQLFAVIVQRWKALDRKWRVWSAVTALAALLLPLLFVLCGRASKPPEQESRLEEVEAGSRVVDDPRGSTSLPCSPSSQPAAVESRRDAPPSQHSPPPDDPAPLRRKIPSEYVADPRLAEAYLIQKRFVTKEIYNSNYVWGPDIRIHYVWQEAGCPGPENWVFSSPEESKIARRGNYFRIRGWVTFKARQGDSRFPHAEDATLSYICRLELDPELETWKLDGHIEQIK